MRSLSARPTAGSRVEDSGCNHTTTNKEYTMIQHKVQKVMEKDGVVAIATVGPDGPHRVNTWNNN